MVASLSDAPNVLRAAREDAGMTQQALADAVSLREAHIADIESGRRPIARELLDRLLAAADYRPALALAAHREALIALGRCHGIRGIHVFGSVVHRTDHHWSDVDLLVSIEQGADPLRFALFVADGTDLLGFPVDAVADGQALIRTSGSRQCRCDHASGQF